SEDMKTHEIKTQLSYKLTKKLSAFSGWRYKKYSIDDFSLTGKNLDDNFTNGNIGLKYNFSDVVYVKFSYGLGLFAEDEDKDIYFSNSLNEKFKENLKSRGAAYYDINAALDAEDYYEKTKFIVFEGTVTF
ncbi:MAG TPA: TonB-dependent receptor, partial [bacterium]|nr:TonB-dependent receptor [bacterium]